MFRISVSYKILNLEISCMSFIKHCCLDEYDKSNSCILNCYIVPFEEGLQETAF